MSQTSKATEMASEYFSHVVVKEQVAELYDRVLVPAIFREWVPRVVELAQPRAGDRVLDVACGTGIVALHAAEAVAEDGAVVGLDLNPTMLAVARSKPSPLPIDWHPGRAESLPFPDAAFTVVYCQLGLQFFEDRPGALHEMHRVLAPRGRLGLLVWGPLDRCSGYLALRVALERHVSPEASAFMDAVAALGDVEALRALIASAGFRDVGIRSEMGTVRFASAEDFVRYTIAATPLASLVAGVGQEARAALIRNVRAALSPHQSAEGLAFPIEGLLASGRK
jgi:ubiquinone/menaquinone biosynthesis C-methylase UbiE